MSERVWQYWRDAEERFDEPAVVLMFTSTLSQQEALDALGRAASDAIREREARAEQAGPGEEEFRTGQWSLAPVPSGVALRIDEEPDDFEGLMQLITDGLEALGVEGAFDLYAPETVAQVPERVHLLECRLRVKGERYHLRYNKYRWKADSEALVECCRRRDRMVPPERPEPASVACRPTSSCGNLAGGGRRSRLHAAGARAER